MNFVIQVLSISVGAFATRVNFYNGEYLFTTRTNSTAPITWDPSHTFGLNISPRSPVWTRYSSFSIITNGEESGHVFANRTLDQFSRDHCLDDSVLRLPIRIGYFEDQLATNIRVQHYQFSLEGQGIPMDSRKFFSSPTATDSGVYLVDGEYALDVPIEVMHELESRVSVVEYGENDKEYIRFGNCAAVRRELPTIVVSLSSGTNSKMEIRFAPEEYTAFVNEQDDVCDMLLEGPSYGGENEDVFLINIFYLKHTNFWFSKSHFGICQAL